MGTRESGVAKTPRFEHSTKEQLLSLPGVTAAGADLVIAGRPYNAPGEVVTWHVTPKTEYEKIADQGHGQEMTASCSVVVTIDTPK